MINGDSKEKIEVNSRDLDEEVLTILYEPPEARIDFIFDWTWVSYPKVNKYIAEKRLRGETNINTYIIEKQQRTAFPFSTFILTLIGVSLASRKTKGGTGLKLGIGILISFIKHNVYIRKLINNSNIRRKPNN